MMARRTSELAFGWFSRAATDRPVTAGRRGVATHRIAPRSTRCGCLRLTPERRHVVSIGQAAWLAGFVAGGRRWSRRAWCRCRL